MRKLKYLVVGTGRSGTVYMAKLLTSLGVPCGHEAIFDYRGIEAARARLCGEISLETSWVSRAVRNSDGTWRELSPWLQEIASAEAESSYLAAPFLLDECLTNTRIIHVVRNPIKVIQSYCHYVGFGLSHVPSNGYEELIYSHLVELTVPMPQYDRVALFWLRWNAMIEKVCPAFFHRIESGPEAIRDFIGGVGEPFDDRTANTFRRASSDHFSPKKIQSKEIREEFIATGRRYGYSTRLDQVMG
jgi:hypothetical protein